jgi:hypothetical protein
MPNLPTSPHNPSALPERGIDRLFSSLLAMYGRHWLDMWIGCDIERVKAEWASALQGLDGECISRALDAMRTEGKPFPPTQTEFVCACRQFRRHGLHRLALVDNRREGPKQGFESLKDILAKAAPQ